MDFRHLIVTCLFSMLRLSFETQKIKENYAILNIKTYVFIIHLTVFPGSEQQLSPQKYPDRRWQQRLLYTRSHNPVQG